METNATNNPKLTDRQIYNIPAVSGKEIGDTVKYDGKTYKIEQHFNQGHQADASQYNHFMYNDRGVFGLREI